MYSTTMIIEPMDYLANIDDSVSNEYENQHIILRVVGAYLLGKALIYVFKHRKA
jgi:hypothetical protein